MALNDEHYPRQLFFITGRTKMTAAIRTMFLTLVMTGVAATITHAQETPAPATPTTAVSETRVPLAEPTIAFDMNGQAAVAGRLRTTALTGTPDAPTRNSRFVVENRSSVFYTYVTGWATFYDAEGVRCGEGLWKLEAFAPGESAEVDTPGLRLTCSPASWRIVAVNLLTRTGDVAKSPAVATPEAVTTQIATTATSAPGAAPATPALPPLEININGKTLPLQPGNPMEITVGRERVRIVVSPAP